MTYPHAMDMEPYRLTAVQAQAKIRRGDLTVQEYAQSLLRRIQERDPVVEAWAYLNPDQVLGRAKELDQIPVGERGPLHGVAIGIKDVIYTKDMPTQQNSPIYVGHAPEVDAASIIVLRQAGALLMGKTCTTEFAATVEGPKTHNPHDAERTPGGSSSGSGAVVADFQVPIALGTQTGGSTIRPASFNGIYAMKPTWNAVSREGQKMYSAILDTIGLYARSIEDIKLLLEVFAVKDDEPPPSSPFVIKGGNFAVMKTPVWPKAGPGTVKAMEKAGKILREHGARVEEIEVPNDLQGLPDWHSTVLSGDGRTAFLPEYRLCKDKLAASIVQSVENKKKISRVEYLRAFDAISAARPRVDDILSKFDAVIVPSAPDEAPVGIENTGNAAFNGMWTALHVPVVNIPGFKGENGMPIGISLVAPRHRDQNLLHVCKAVGDLFERDGGWKSQL